MHRLIVKAFLLSYLQSINIKRCDTTFNVTANCVFEYCKMSYCRRLVLLSIKSIPFKNLAVSLWWYFGSLFAKSVARSHCLFVFTVCTSVHQSFDSNQIFFTLYPYFRYFINIFLSCVAFNLLYLLAEYLNFN